MSLRDRAILPGQPGLIKLCLCLEAIGPFRPVILAVPGRWAQASEELLEELRPSFVVVMEPDLGLTRRLEVYRAGNPRRWRRRAGEGLRVYFAVYGGSVEEQRYMSEVRGGAVATVEEA